MSEKFFFQEQCAIDKMYASSSWFLKSSKLFWGLIKSDSLLTRSSFLSQINKHWYIFSASKSSTTFPLVFFSKCGPGLGPYVKEFSILDGWTLCTDKMAVEKYHKSCYAVVYYFLVMLLGRSWSWLAWHWQYWFISSHNGDIHHGSCGKPLFQASQ